MDESNNFYVHLPSNNLTNIETNTLGRYVTQMKRPIKLDQHWEVALTEISYTKSWFTLDRDVILRIVAFNMRERSVVEENSQTYGLQLGADPWTGRISDDEFDVALNSRIITFAQVYKGNYSIRELLKAVNKAVEDACNMHVYKQGNDDIHSVFPPELGYTPNGRICITTGRTSEYNKDGRCDTLFNLTGDLADILGWSWEEDPYFMTGVHISTKCFMWISPHHPQIRGGRYSLFVYTDIIRSVHVGDTKANLLRMVDIPDDVPFGDQVVIRYQSPEYKKLATSEITSIEIYIKDDSGSDIPFEFGRTICTFHFKRVDNIWALE
jgi:hypothetical protein